MDLHHPPMEPVYQKVLTKLELAQISKNQVIGPGWLKRTFCAIDRNGGPAAALILPAAK